MAARHACVQAICVTSQQKSGNDGRRSRAASSSGWQRYIWPMTSQTWGLRLRLRLRLRPSSPQRCMWGATTIPSRNSTKTQKVARRRPLQTFCCCRTQLERAKRFELSTLTLARLCSTPELRPRPWVRAIYKLCSGPARGKMASSENFRIFCEYPPKGRTSAGPNAPQIVANRQDGAGFCAQKDTQQKDHHAPRTTF